MPAAEQGTVEDGRATPHSGEPAPPGSGRTPRWPWLLAGAVAVVSAGAVVWLVFAPKADVWTDDAYVRVHYATIAPRVSGTVTAVAVDNNRAVKAGDLLVALDDRDYRTAVASAEAHLDRDGAMLDDAVASVERQKTVIAQAKAQLDASSAQVALAQSDADRSEQLASTGYGTVKTREQADTALLQAKSALATARASSDSAAAQLKVAEAQRRAAQATVAADQAALDQARLNLSYTRVLAPLDGTVAERSVQLGNYVTPGAGLMAVVPLQDVYVDANFREVQLAHVKGGQRATIHVDAYGVDLRGTVVGVPAATGTTFATIPSEDATGNFTKIVQRLPVEIRVDKGQPLANLLRVDLSVEVRVETGLADVVGEQRGSDTSVTSERQGTP